MTHLMMNQITTNKKRKISNHTSLFNLYRKEIAAFDID